MLQDHFGCYCFDTAGCLLARDGVLEALGSRNGSSLRGRKLTGATAVSSGDALPSGEAELLFRVDAAPEGETESAG